MKRFWNVPGGEVQSLYLDMLKQPHLLIAGATGSGKSVVINGIITTALHFAPSEKQFILIDPKRVELSEYAQLPHTIAHAKGFDAKAWHNALRTAVNIMDARYTEMEHKGLREYQSGSDVYVIIDEYATIAKAGGKGCYESLLRLVSEGRAAHVHCIIATQVPKADIIKTEIRENCTARLCLRCNSRVESRVLMDMPGCESLPQYGQGFYITPKGNTLYNIPKPDAKQHEYVMNHWKEHKRPVWKWKKPA